MFSVTRNPYAALVAWFILNNVGVGNAGDEVGDSKFIFVMGVWQYY